jgi:hypothetical protein
MDINTITFVRDLMHAISLAVLIVVVGAIIIGVTRPRLLKFVLREFADRKYILIGGLFVSLLCGTIYTATESIYTANQPIGPQTIAQQPVINLPENQNPAQQVRGINTEKSTDPSQDSVTPAPQATSTDPPPQPQNEVLQNTAPAQTNTEEGTSGTTSAKEHKCKVINVLFVCL